MVAFERVRTFLYVFMSFVRVFVREELWINVAVAMYKNNKNFLIDVC